MAQRKYPVKISRETDGRIIAEIAKLPGVLGYGRTIAEAKKKAFVLGLRVMAEQIENGGTRVNIPCTFSIG